MTTPLETALSAARKKDHGATLASLLTAFRANRHPRVAALVAQASELAEKGRPAIAGKNLDHKLTAALALLEAGDPADLPRVLRLLRELRLAQAKTLVEHLAAVKSDPRVLDATLALLRDPPLVSSTAMPLWRALLSVLEAQDDPRTVPALSALDFSWLSEWGAEQFRAACARVGRPKKGKAEAARPEPTLGADDEAACAALEEALGHTTGDGTSLLAAIRAAPYDDAARAVWADWLEEQGDPRGRFVAVQLATATRAPTDEERKAMRDLLAAHGEAWLSDLVGVVRPEYTRFARGFLAEVGIGGDQLHRLVESEHAATLETLWLHGHDAFDPALLHRLPALRFVGGIEPAWFADLDRHGPFPFPGLGLDLYGALPYGDEPLSAAQHAMLAEAGALRTIFPAVERVAISAFSRDPALLEGLLASPLVAGVRELRLSGSRVKSWLDRRHLLPDSVQELEVSFDFGFHDWTHRFFRDAEGRFSRLVATLRPKRSDFGGGKLEELAEVLDGLPTDLLVEVEVHADGTRVTKGALDPIVEAARRHPGLRKLSLPGRPDALAGATATAKAPPTRAEEGGRGVDGGHDRDRREARRHPLAGWRPRRPRRDELERRAVARRGTRAAPHQGRPGVGRSRAPPRVGAAPPGAGRGCAHGPRRAPARGDRRLWSRAAAAAIHRVAPVRRRGRRVQLRPGAAGRSRARGAGRARELPRLVRDPRGQRREPHLLHRQGHPPRAPLDGGGGGRRRSDGEPQAEPRPQVGVRRAREGRLIAAPL